MTRLRPDPSLDNRWPLRWTVTSPFNGASYDTRCSNRYAAFLREHHGYIVEPSKDPE